jgi:hypothetical protein
LRHGEQGTRGAALSGADAHQLAKLRLAVLTLPTPMAKNARERKANTTDAQ